MLVCIDHGNKQIKTTSRTFTSGLMESDTRPPFGDNIMFYNGKYYTLSDQRKCCTAAACKYAVEESAGNGPVGGAKWKSEMCCLLLAPLQNSRRNTICPKKHPKDMIHA